MDKGDIIVHQDFVFRIETIHQNLHENTLVLMPNRDKPYSGDIVIPMTISYKNRDFMVSAIAEGTFKNCRNLTSVYIPATVAEIYDFENPFLGCENLKKIIVSKHNRLFKSGGKSLCYYDCELGYGEWRLLTLLPNNKRRRYIGHVGNIAFNAVDKNIKYLTIGSNCLHCWDDGYFEGCNSLRHLCIGESVERVGVCCFAGCKSLRRVVFEPRGGRKIRFDYSCFNGCESLESIKLPKGTEFECNGNWAFADCTSLKEIILEDGIKNIGMGTFYECTSLTTIDFPDSIEEIGISAFENCTSLKSLHFGKGIKRIKSKAFSGCKSLKTVYLPHNDIEIADDAFDDHILIGYGKDIATRH